MKRCLVILFLLIAVPCWAITVSKQNIRPKADYKADGDTFFMCNITCAEENTVLKDVKNCTFIKSNIRNCILDETNMFERSIYRPEKIISEVIKTEDELRIEQLEKFITDNHLVVPIKAEVIE